MTALNDHLIKLIQLHGPITISNYMAEALTNPKYGYYVNQNPFGTKGDFITAPDVSQMFGELIGLWFADIWLKMKSPKKVHLIELGPGRGTLMADFLRVINVVPEFLEALDLHFVEASPNLIQVQKDKFKNYPNKKSWHETVKSALRAAEEENAVTFVIANEFFDALPIRQFQKTDLGWHERMVTVNEEGNGLTNMLSPFPVQDVKLSDHFNDAELHSVIEVSPMSEFVTHEISTHIKKYTGAALFIDYGYTDHQTGETLQAVEKHKFTSIFSEPGFADLSAHVNFRKVIDVIESIDLKPLGPTSQGKFLTDMGIEERVKTLIDQATQEQTKDTISALKRLIAPDEMGTLFKVAGMISDHSIETVGF